MRLRARFLPKPIFRAAAWQALLLVALALPAAAAETLRWPSPWKDGQRWDYRTEYVDEESADGETNEMRVSGISTMRVERDATGLVQVWSSRDSRVEALRGDRTAADLMAQIMGDIDAIVLELRLDGDGRADGLRNLADAHARMRAAMQRVVDATVETILREEGEDAPAEQREALRGMIGGMMSAQMDELISPEAVDALLTVEFRDFNAFTGMAHTQDRTVRDRSRMHTPLSGRALPARREYRLQLDPATPDRARIVWTTTLDQRAADADALWTLVAESAGDPSLAEGEGRPKGLSAAESGHIDWRRSDGAVLGMEIVRSGAYGETYRRHERETYTLVAEGTDVPAP